MRCWWAGLQGAAKHLAVYKTGAPHPPHTHAKAAQPPMSAMPRLRTPTLRGVAFPSPRSHHGTELQAVLPHTFACCMLSPSLTSIGIEIHYVRQGAQGKPAQEIKGKLTPRAAQPAAACVRGPGGSKPFCGAVSSCPSSMEARRCLAPRCSPGRKLPWLV